ncbi:F-box only protein 27-like [Monodon monoceros]|uniref:F-box only protein 27-like n=1 Tax=Monodon monoceros TaxID=40151 RepID=UPI0010F5E5A3|nr:F-box only protein 27-like [Monodon monoceros]
MGASASRNWLVGVSALEPEPEEPLGLGQLPTELLEMVLSHVPPHVLLGRCRRVCRRWRDLVDCQALWLSILSRDHAALSPVLRTCLPAADDPRPCVLGRFCERRPIGRNLLQNPRGLGGEPRKGVLLKGAGGRGRMRGALGLRGGYHKKQVLDLEKEGFWRELLDSGKIEICVSDWRNDQQGTDCVYQLTVQLLDADQAILDHFSPLPFPIWKWRNSVSPRVSHVFSNLKKGVRFVSFECCIWDLEFRNEQYGISVTNSSVIVQKLIPMAEKIPAPTGGELNPMAFQDWDQDSELKFRDYYYSLLQ